jgi:pimeloyl-ACP methyl ester carboxylesterase
MAKTCFVIFMALPCVSRLLASRAAEDLPQRVDGGGHFLRMRAEGAGTPAVVLEIGLGGFLEEWAAVQPDVARRTRVAAYDRLGARHAISPISGREIARELHSALVSAQVNPPYILVGQSFGAIYNRIFAAIYPDEVAGLVLLDPAQEQFIDWMETHHPEDGLARFPRHHWPEALGIEATLEELKTLGPLPDVPVVVVTGTRRGQDAKRDALLPVWTAMHGDWVRALPQGRHVLADKSGHAIQIDQPELVVDLIIELVKQARACKH